MNKQRRLRIGWSSNAPWGYSGYATQSNLIVPRLAEAGFPIGFNAFAGLMCGYINTNNSEFELKGRWEGIPIYPANGHAYGSDGLWLNLQNHFKADIIIPFQDIFTLHTDDIQKVGRMVPYVPIDRDPVPPPVLQYLNFAWRIISYSQWGHDQLLKSGYASEMIPHGVDLEQYKPEDKANAKLSLQIEPDTFVFGMVAANKEWPPRKGFQQALDAFARFVALHPNTILWFHVDVMRPGGFNIPQYAQYLGIADKIRFISARDMEFFQVGDMNHLYNAFDCLLMPSYSEGFGIPAIEAQAAGVPVIVNGFSALTETVEHEKTGYVCKPGIKRFDPQGAYHQEVDLEDLYDAMEKVYAVDRVKMGKEARKFVSHKYDINKIVKNNWIPYLAKLENDIYGKLAEEKTPDPLDDAMEQSLQKLKSEFGENTIKIIE